MSTSEFLHLMIIFCILLRRNAYILKQLSKTFQKSTFSSHLCSWVQDYVWVFSLFPVNVVWCEGELRNWATEVSGNERKQLQAPHGWDTGIMALPGLGSVQTLPGVEASFQLWELVEVQWWKLGCWAPPSWVLGLVIPSNHSMPCHLQTAVPRAWPQLHRRDCSREVYCTCRACAQGLFPNHCSLLYCFQCFFSMQMLYLQRQVQYGKGVCLPRGNTGQLLLKFGPDLHQL